MQQSYYEKRIAQPDAFYEHPSRVLADQKLSDDEKIEVLESMKVDSELLAQAKAEGMTGGETNRLQDVQQALIKLRKNPTQAS